MAIFILDDEGQFLREAETDEIGTVCISGPNVFKGYIEDRHNQGIWPKEGWLNTGDMGRQDADGYFWITGRKKELIIRGGHNIDPVLIEEPLYQLPEVQVAAAIGRPDSRVGEIPVAYVQLQPGADITPESILEHLQKTVGERAAIPKEVFIVDEVPLTTVGKIFKPALKWDLTRRVFELELEAMADVVNKIEVVVAEDKIHGSSAVITIEPLATISVDEAKMKVDELLGGFAIHYQIKISS